MLVAIISFVAAIANVILAAREIRTWRATAQTASAAAEAAAEAGEAATTQAGATEASDAAATPAPTPAPARVPFRASGIAWAIAFLAIQLFIGVWGALGLVQDEPVAPIIMNAVLIGCTHLVLARPRLRDRFLATFEPGGRWPHPQAACALTMVAAGIFTTLALELPSNHNLLWMYPLCLLLEVFLITALVAGAFYLFQRRGGAAAVVSFVFFAIGIAEYFVITFKSQPIQPGDLTAIATAAAVGGGYIFSITSYCLYGIVALALAMLASAYAALFRPGFGECELCQGLTTTVNGNCGMSLAPLSGAHADECAKYLAPITGNIPPELRFASIDSYFKAAQGRGLPLSCAELIGMGTLRTLAAGFTTGDLSPLELRDLHYHMEAALADGACGVSLGLGYAPEIFYSTDGLIRALAPLHRSGVPICVHMRQEGDGVVDALREMLEVARALQTPLEISHLKAIGGRNARKAVPEMLSLIERARQDGLDVMCDVYPYTAGSTQLIHVLPPEFQEGGTEALTKRLLDDAARKEMRARMEAGSDFENITLLVGFDNVVAIGLRTDEYRRFEGKSVAEIARTLQKDPFDTLFDLLAAEQCNTGMIDYISDEEDVKDILRTPFSGVISDATYPSGGRVHPRVYGTFARLIEKYVVQERVLTLEQAVHKVTGHAADRFGFEKKGVIAAGMDADLLLFSPENVREHGTYARPNLPATGFDEVFVLGERVIENGVYRGGSSGEMLGARMGY